jgi:ABC-type bacteriocin/lantibiotic exporter with double-glycine peptidase domain
MGQWLVRSLVLLTFTAVSEPSRLDASNGELDRWRSVDRDCVNAVYMLLRYHGIPRDYSDVYFAFSTTQKASNLRDLRDIGSYLGLDVVVYQCASPQEIVTLPRPVVVHFAAPAEAAQSGSGRQGTLHLVTGRNAAGDYYLLTCGTVSFQVVSEETFRRHWSGYVVVVDSRRHEALKDALLTALLSIVGIGAVAVYTRRTRRREVEV